MPWFRVDDSLAMSRKVYAMPSEVRLAAIGLWTLCGTWCAKELTDGRLPAYMLSAMGGTEEIAAALVDVGLWLEDGGDYVFHDWAEYQPASEDVKAKRQKNADRLRAWREKNAVTNKVGNAVTPPVTNVVSNAVTSPVTDDVTNDVRNGSETLPPSHPIPSHPDPLVLVKEGARKRASRIPDDFEISESLRSWATANVPNLDIERETENFTDYWRAASGQNAAKLDWDATWRKWMRTTNDRTQPKARSVDQLPPAYRETPAPPRESLPW